MVIFHVSTFILHLHSLVVLLCFLMELFAMFTVSVNAVHYETIRHLPG